MKLIYLKSALKCDSFDVIIGIKIPFFRVSVIIELGRSLLQFVTKKLFDSLLNFRFKEERSIYLTSTFFPFLSYFD